MEQIPFFPKLVIWGPIISGIFFILLSFSKKQPNRLKIRYCGIFIVLCGGCLALFLPSSNNVKSGNSPELDKLFAQLANTKKTEILQKNAGIQEKSGWFKSTGGEGAYSAMFPKQYIEYKTPVKNNATCSEYYSASTIDNKVQYIIEYIKCSGLDIQIVAENLRKISTANISSVEEQSNTRHPTFDVVEVSPHGKVYIRTILTDIGQFTLNVRPHRNGIIRKEMTDIFYNSFDIN